MMILFVSQNLMNKKKMMLNKKKDFFLATTCREVFYVKLEVEFKEKKL